MGSAIRRQRPGLAHSSSLLCILLAASGCATDVLKDPPALTGTQCVDDSPQCIGKRQADLKAMMADKSKAWVRQPADAKAHASGVRLFAYRGKRRELSCDELAHGKREADAAPAVLKGPGATGLTPAQVSRGTMLAGEVARELGVEMTRRCRRG